MAKGTSRRKPAKKPDPAVDTAADAPPVPTAIERAEEEGKINFDTGPDPRDEVEHNEHLSDVGDSDTFERAIEEGKINLADSRIESADTPDSADYVENGAVGEAEGGSKKNRKASVGQLVGYVSSARRAGIRNRAEEAAIVTGVNDDGSLSLTIFGVDGQRLVRKVGSNRNHEEHWKPLAG